MMGPPSPKRIAPFYRPSGRMMDYGLVIGRELSVVRWKGERRASNIEPKRIMLFRELRQARRTVGGLCAVLFSCMGDKPTQAEYFARTALSSYRGEAYGHTGQGFSYLWTELAANMGGPAAAEEYEKRLRWDRDLKRRSDGSFVYEGGDQWGPGQAHDRLAADGVAMINAYWDTSYEYWMNPTTCYLLHAGHQLQRIGLIQVPCE